MLAKNVLIMEIQQAVHLKTLSAITGYPQMATLSLHSMTYNWPPLVLLPFSLPLFKFLMDGNVYDFNLQNVVLCLLFFILLEQGQCKIQHNFDLFSIF